MVEVEVAGDQRFNMGDRERGPRRVFDVADSGADMLDVHVRTNGARVQSSRLSF